MTTPTTTRCPFEHAKPEEQGQIAELSDITRKLIDKRYPGKQKKLRAVHPKSHGCVSATFKVNESLSEDLRVGLFSNPGKEFKAKIRFSNAAPTVSPDIVNGEHGSRGMAMKIMDVGGQVLLKDESKHNQDFLMINQPAFAFANIEDYLVLNQVLLDHNDDLTLFLEDAPILLEKDKNSPQDLTEQEQRKVRTLKILMHIKATPVASPLSTEYFGAAPFLFGDDRLMMFMAKPLATDDQPKLPDEPAEDYLAEALADAMNESEDVTFSFAAQIRVAADDLGIENASTEWDRKKFKFQELAQITIPAPQRVENWEALAFNPWHSLIEHRPIGSINRLRQEVYLTSSGLR